MILDRTQFVRHFNGIRPGLGDPDSGLWAGERDRGYRSEWFLHTTSLGDWRQIRDDYWHWCHRTLQGRVACYSSGDEWEWWGFTRREDIVIWKLKWS